MNITKIEGVRKYLTENSGFSHNTINNVIVALGHPLTGSAYLKDLSSDFECCANYGANIGIHGFIYTNETTDFYQENREDIVSHMVNTASEFGTDIISMVQNFGIFRNSGKPSPEDIGKALWGSIQCKPEYKELYNVFAWYTLEEVSQSWLRYLEDNEQMHPQGVDELCSTL
jgi:hypothetical protein